jgi:acyl-CoA reductase-like NAD-dependent aldehyde dehydrogenase
MLAVAKVMAERAAGILPIFLDETGASAAALGGVFDGVVSRFTDYAYAAAQAYDEPIRPTQAGQNLVNALVRRRPVGVVASIGSYNVPVAVITRVAAALAMGNTVVLKAPPQDPLSLTELVRCLRRLMSIWSASPAASKSDSRLRPMRHETSKGSCATSSTPVTGPLPVTRLSTPGGNPASWNRRHPTHRAGPRRARLANELTVAHDVARRDAVLA